MFLSSPMLHPPMADQKPRETALQVEGADGCRDLPAGVGRVNRQGWDCQVMVLHNLQCRYWLMAAKWFKTKENFDSDIQDMSSIMTPTNISDFWGTTSNSVQGLCAQE